ncbi:MAG: hypothetical protein JNL22_16800 [Bacteroidales bacterium]|nr:hypothetical protein [Bacteroidales bacterium]
MKQKKLLIAFMIAMITGAMAQKPAMTLTFTAVNNGQYVPLNSILIENLTQGGDTTLYAPDTVLRLNYVLGLNENSYPGNNGLSLSQNYPNPMEGRTTVSLWLPERNDILITISDVVGKELLNQEFKLEQGAHTFSFRPGRESIYLLTASADEQSRTIKMFNSTISAIDMEFCILEYNGRNGDTKDYKSFANLNNFVFDPGDQLQYTASSALGDRIITDTQTGNKTYTFQYADCDAPCPGMPTVTDIDGNQYNTVLIGSQCWMKENLKTTTYRNGTAIPNVTDGNLWCDLTTGAYAWYYNEISWKNRYGALYNWYTTVDPNGLCPTGWHVPTDDEWTALTDYIGGTGEPHGSELKSCKQVNSPIGGDCNTNEHPRWTDYIIYNDNYGTDDYGFSGLPGGTREIVYGYFQGMGDVGNWWSSSENSSSYPWYRCLPINKGVVCVATFNKEDGFSVRCLRD